MKRLVLMLALSTATLARAGEELVAVIVAANDIPAGTKVTLEMLSQRSLPKRLATSSIVKPDSVSYVIDQPTARPVLAGDLITWTSFEVTDPRAVEACERKFSAKPATATDQVRRARAAVIKR